MKDWHIEHFQLKDLIENPRNPRTLSKDEFNSIKASIEKFGCVQLPITDGNKMIVGGHQRVKALKKLKIKSVDCWVPNEPLSHNEVDEFNIRLNKNQGKFDFEELANEWESEDLLSWGFKESELFGIEEPIELEEPEKKKKEKSCPHCGEKL